MRTRMRSSLLSFFAACVFIGAAGVASAQAIPGPGPQELIEKVSQDMLRDIDANRAALRQDPAKLRALVDKNLLPNFDADYAARLVLGKHWRTATPEQQHRFVEAFIQSMMRQYGTALLDFTGDRLTILPFKGDPAATTATVRTEVKRDNGTPVPVNYTMRGTPQRLEGLGRYDRGRLVREELPYRLRLGDRREGARCRDPAPRDREHEFCEAACGQGVRQGRMMAGHFAIERAGPGRLVASGELGFATAAQALRQGDELIRREQACVIDLGRVESGDSAGVAVLVDWLASAKARGTTIAYESIPAQMLAIARISDLEDLLLAAEDGALGTQPVYGAGGGTSASASSIASCSSGSIGVSGGLPSWIRYRRRCRKASRTNVYLS